MKNINQCQRCQSTILILLGSMVVIVLLMLVKADSLDKVELIMAMEEDFSIAISDDAAEKLHTINDYLIIIEKKLSH